MSLGRFGAARQGGKRGMSFFVSIILTTIFLCFLFFPLISYNIAKECIFSESRFSSVCIVDARDKSSAVTYLEQLKKLSREIGLNFF